ncbi:MAG: class I adenylate-forming enzyme family protein [Chloroflexia bacterium]
MNPDTLAGALEATWNRRPDAPALVYGNRSLKYAQLGDAVTALAGAQRRLGIGAGDRIVCSVSNRPEKVIALGAAWASGAVHVGVDYQFTAPELSSVINMTQAGALIYEPVGEASDPFLPLGILRKEYPDLPIIVVGDLPVPGEFVAFSRLIETTPGSLPPIALEGPSPQDPALIFISSGTTGIPKATLGYQGNLSQRWQRLAGWLGFGPDDVHLAQMPLSHGFGLMMAMGALLTGGQLVLLDKFSAEAALQVIESERVTVLNGSPTHFKLILDRLDPQRHDVSSLRFSVGTAAFFSASLVRSIWDKLNVKFMFMYGSSEGVGVATTEPDDILRGSVGKPAPGAAIIVDSEHEPLPVGETGEIAFSRKVYPIKYWGEPGHESLATALQPESANGNSTSWYYSGDLGRMDDEGRLYVFGRLKHQIDRGGLKIDPVEVEAALLQHPDVSDGAVIGLPNPILGEVACACVVPASEQPPTLEEIRTFLSGELAPYKLPDELCVLDEIPRTQIGKVDLKKLRELVAETATQSLRPR